MIHDMAINESWMKIHELAMMVNLGRSGTSLGQETLYEDLFPSGKKSGVATRVTNVNP